MASVTGSSLSTGTKNEATAATSEIAAEDEFQPAGFCNLLNSLCLGMANLQTGDPATRHHCGKLRAQAAIIIKPV